MDRSDFTSLLLHSQLSPRLEEPEARPPSPPSFAAPGTPASLLNGSQILGPASKNGNAPIHPELRHQMNRYMVSEKPSRPPVSPPSHLSNYAPAVATLVNRIHQDLESSLVRLLSLNPSRREAIAQHLDRLAGIAPGPTASGGAGDAAGGLRRWIEGPRTPAQNTALQAYFEEVASVVLGQAILLKAWSDRGVRTWKEDDLAHLNWVLSTFLKPQVPLDREGWQITRPNLYSWYNPATVIQREIWNEFREWRIIDEGPGMLVGLLRMARQTELDRPEHGGDPRGYDERFFGVIWENLHHFGIDPNATTGVINRKRVVFSPTLRDGAMVRTGPGSLTWVGLDAYPLQLMIAELAQLWWGSAPPPVWGVGTGLEVHARDQLTLNLNSPKPSLLSRIVEMEACDLAFVLEEKTVRSQGRGAEASRFRELAESLPYFKKLRAAGTSLGDLQACVALSKLRPSGLMWWAREEPLSQTDGAEALGYLLDRAKLVCEWDFSSLEHTLPVRIPLFPKHLYLFVRETNLQEKLSHRPHRVTLQGQIRSHVEVPLILSDALQALVKQVQPHGHWQIVTHQSPTTQKEWTDRWPDPTTQEAVQALESLRTASAPLGSLMTVRATPEGDASKDHSWSVHPTLRGFWLKPENDEQGRRLVSLPLPYPGAEAKGTGFLVLVPDEASVAPLKAYLESKIVCMWLEHNIERRGNRWVLKEQDIKWIPVPNLLISSLGTETSFALPLPGDWEKLASEVSYQPRLVYESLSRLAQTEEDKRIRAALFVRAARALDQLRSGQRRLFSMISADGTVRWRDLMDILPKAEMTPVSLHPKIRISGSMPLHLSISRMERVKTPMPGILLATESGFNLHIGSETSIVLDMIWEQLQGLTHPTWSELVQYLRLPRRVEVAEATASDIIRSHGEQSIREKELAELLEACLGGL